MLDSIILAPDDPAPVDQPLMRILDHTGDTRLSWDPANQGETDAARAHFESLKSKGFLAYRGSGRDRETIDQFDPSAREITMSPQIVGG